MTPEQIQQAIEGMLSIQRELQNSQLRFESELDGLKQSVSGLAEQSRKTDERFQATDRRFEQLIGYSINRERDSLDIQQDILDLRHRVVAIERKLTES
jgi:peptidoglycan hydrolase CwlO-like protein